MRKINIHSSMELEEWRISTHQYNKYPATPAIRISKIGLESQVTTLWVRTQFLETNCGRIPNTNTIPKITQLLQSKKLSLVIKDKAAVQYSIQSYAKYKREPQSVSLFDEQLYFQKTARFMTENKFDYFDILNSTIWEC